MNAFGSQWIDFGLRVPYDNDEIQPYNEYNRSCSCSPFVKEKQASQMEQRNSLILENNLVGNAVESPKSLKMAANPSLADRMNDKMNKILERAFQLKSALHCVTFKREQREQIRRDGSREKTFQLMDNISTECLEQLQESLISDIYSL